MDYAVGRHTERASAIAKLEFFNRGIVTNSFSEDVSIDGPRRPIPCHLYLLVEYCIVTVSIMRVMQNGEGPSS